jgi:hypothetical protein
MAVKNQRGCSMNARSIKLIPLLLVCCTFPSTAQEAATVEPVVVPGMGIAGQVAYPGSYGIPEIVRDRLAELMDGNQSTTAEYSITIDLPVITDNEQRIANLEGLPIAEAPSTAGSRDVRMSILFHSVDHVKDGVLDESAFLASIDRVTENLLATHPDSGSKDSATTEGIVDAPGCGGAPLGTTIEERFANCPPGTTSNTYECMNHPSTGRADWWRTHAEYMPPSTACDSGST